MRDGRGNRSSAISLRWDSCHQFGAFQAFGLRWVYTNGFPAPPASGASGGRSWDFSACILHEPMPYNKSLSIYTHILYIDVFISQLSLSPENTTTRPLRHSRLGSVLCEWKNSHGGKSEGGIESPTVTFAGGGARRRYCLCSSVFLLSWGWASRLHRQELSRVHCFAARCISQQHLCILPRPSSFRSPMSMCALTTNECLLND